MTEQDIKNAVARGSLLQQMERDFNAMIPSVLGKSALTESSELTEIKEKGDA